MIWGEGGGRSLRPVVLEGLPYHDDYWLARRPHHAFPDQALPAWPEARLFRSSPDQVTSPATPTPPLPLVSLPIVPSSPPQSWRPLPSPHRQSKEAELDRVQDRLDCLETDIRAVARRVDPGCLPGTELEDTGSSREEGEDSSNASGSGVSPRDPAPGPDPTQDLAGAPLFVPGGKRARLSQHLDGLLAAYEARRGAGAGASVPGSDGGGLGALAGALDLVHRAAALETVAVIPRPPGARPNSIVSGLEYNSRGNLFACAGVSRRIRWGAGGERVPGRMPDPRCTPPGQGFDTTAPY